MKNVFIASALSLSISSAFAANLTVTNTESEINWQSVPTVEKVLFFPGKVTYSWLNSPEHKGTQNKHFDSRKCGSCHTGEEAGLGNMLVKQDEPALKDKNVAASMKGMKININITIGDD